MRTEIRAVLAEESMFFMKMAAVTAQRIGNSFDGSVGGYAAVVKQDLEACGLIHSVPKTKPPRLAIKHAD